MSGCSSPAWCAPTMRLTEDVVGADSAVVAELRRRGVRSFAAFLMCDPDWIVANVPGMTKEAEVSVCVCV